jgi:hypothetical protein
VDFFDIVVRADMKAFDASPGLLEAFHLASSLNHLMDWHWNSNRHVPKPPFGDVRKSMEAQCTELELIRNLCDASKHCGLNRGPVKLAKVETIAGKHGHGGLGLAMGLGVAGTIGQGTPEPRLHASDGSAIWAADAFRAAFRHWESVIATRRVRSK